MALEQRPPEGASGTSTVAILIGSLDAKLICTACAALSATGGMSLNKAAAHRHHGGGLGRLRRHFTPDRSKQVRCGLASLHGVLSF